MIENKTILIFGGTGSLGYKLNQKYCSKNTIYNVSRDEHKHWKMKLRLNNDNINFIVGNTSDKSRVTEIIKRIDADIIIIASAMKHIEQCELNTHESLNNNLLGNKNVLDTIDELSNSLKLQTVVFVSSDKACNPINNYGLCKALSETLLIEKAFYHRNIKFVNVRYGNVLNSNGSIIPRLHLMGKDDKFTHFNLTHKDMTRFIMTLDDSVDLIQHAIVHAKSGDTVISELKSMHIQDLIELFSEKYEKPVKITGLRQGEKLCEALINKSQSARIRIHGKYRHITSILDYNDLIDPKEMKEYDSTINPMNKDQLKIFLITLDLL